MLKSKSLLIAALAVLTIASGTSAASALSVQIKTPEVVEAQPNEMVPNPTPRTVMEVSPYLSPTMKRAAQSFPEKYDLREQNLVTTVKNQGNWGTCWAFGAISSAESNLIKHGYAPTSINLSEAHLAYFLNNGQKDPLGNTDGDKQIIVGRDEDGSPLDLRNRGGDDKQTLLALSGWVGPVPEEQLPYSALNNLSSISATKTYDRKALLKSAYILSDDPAELKAAIMTYGAVNGAYYSDNDYYSQDDNAFYCSVDEVANHEISVVGWDDNYSMDNFTGVDTPTEDGAWIIKNNWGTDSHDQGYFYLSYEDRTFCDLVAYDYQQASTYDHNYQYDGTIYDAQLEGFSSGTKASNVYQVKGNSAGKEEALKAVGFVCYSPGTQYSIQIYKDLKSKSDPESGTALLSTPVTGTVTGAGYTTAELPTPPVMAQGTTYSIVISITKTPADLTKLGVETALEHPDSSLIVKPKITPNQSFAYDDDGWFDLAEMEEPGCLRIKGLTSDVDHSTDIVTSINLSETSANMASGSTLKLTASTAPTSSSTVKWSSDNDDVASVDAEGNVTAKLSGSAVITATSVVNPEISASCEITVPPLSSSTTVSAASAGYSSIKLSWDQMVVSGYEVYRATSEDGEYDQLTTVSSTSHTDTGLTTGNTYYYKVRGYVTVNGTTQYAPFSDVVSAKPKLSTPSISLKAYTGKVKVSWKKVSGASKYQIYRGNSKTGSFKRIKTTSSTSYTNTGLSKKKTYYYKVRAYKTVNDKSVYGSYSAVKGIKTK